MEDKTKFRRNVQQSNNNYKTVIDKEKLNKYSTGKGVEVRNIRQGVKQHQLKRKERKYREAQVQSARAEILLTETSGCLEAKGLFHTASITQRDIKESVDITAATKNFHLTLNQFGPYKFRYSQNGRHMVLGGRKGHLAAFDWVTKKLCCEVNVMESIHDVCFLHNEQMLAVAQKQWTYIYDKQGTELHCLKSLHEILKLEFLPYHFLLCAGSEKGYLSWLDVTLGKEMISFPTNKGRLDIMCQNPANAVMCCGHSNGTISMWTPNMKEPVLSMFCHPRAVRAIAINPYGSYLATAGADQIIKIWDTRNLGKPVNANYFLSGISNMSFSQKNLLAVSSEKDVQIFRDITTLNGLETYMKHRAESTITGLQFCPYEDVLGISSYQGFSSLIIPGSGEANFDALEANPYRSEAARREGEVKLLLGKIPFDMITLDPSTISQVDVPTLQDKLEAKKKLLYVKVPNIDVQPRYRMKGKSGSAKKFKRKLTMKAEEKRKFLQFMKEKDRSDKMKNNRKAGNVVKDEQILDRFKSKIISKK